MLYAAASIRYSYIEHARAVFKGTPRDASGGTDREAAGASAHSPGRALWFVVCLAAGAFPAERRSSLDAEDRGVNADRGE